MKNSIAGLITWYTTRRRPSRSRKTPSDNKLDYHDVSFASRSLENIQLKGWLIPASKPVGVVILCHGHGGSRKGMLRKAIMLNRYHFTTLLFDFRATGSSEGRFRSFGIGETYDVLGAVDFLKENPLTRSLPIVGIGQSLGGAALIRAAARELEIKAVVAEAVFARLETVLKRRVKFMVGPFVKPVMRSCYRLGEKKFGRDIYKLDPETDIAAISPRPVMLIQDNLDFVCPRSEVNRLFEAALEPKERWVVPRARHTRAFAVAPREYERRVTNFLSRSLCIKPTTEVSEPGQSDSTSEEAL